MKEGGFTLIELIIVIIILGTLSVVAAPRFMSISDDARLATLKGIYANVKKTSEIIAYKCMLDANCDERAPSSTLILNGETYIFSYGSVAAAPSRNGKGLSDLITTDLLFHRDSNWGFWYFEGYPYNGNCGVFYQPAHFYGVLKPTNLALRTSGC